MNNIKQRLLASAVEKFNSGDLAAAAEIYRKVVESYPDCAEAWQGLGGIHAMSGQYIEALSCSSLAARLDPGNKPAISNLAKIHMVLGNNADAIAGFRMVVSSDPDDLTAMYHLGVLLRNTGEYTESRRIFERLYRIMPDNPEAIYNLGEAYYCEANLALSERYNRLFLEKDPDNISAYKCLAIVLREQCKYSEAQILLEGAVRKFDECEGLEFMLAEVLLLQEKFLPGWEAWEARFRNAKQKQLVSRYRYPRWEGQSLDGKGLLAFSEQGVGDEVMFASFFRDIMDVAERCVIECDQRLTPVFGRSFPAATIIPRDAGAIRMLDAVEPDYQSPVGSLPRLLDPLLEKPLRKLPYLLADSGMSRVWNERLAALAPGKLNVGISWYGGTNNKVAHIRSIDLPEWETVLEIQDINFINLQHGTRRSDADAFSGETGLQLHTWDDADPVRDLDMFLAMLSALDLVISVDNSTVHLAGAVGTMTWLCLPFAPDWRWGGDGPDCYWYGSVELFRQPKAGDWKPVLSKVTGRLRKLRDAGSQ